MCSSDLVLFLFDYVGTPTFARVLPLLAYYYQQAKVVNVAPFSGAQPQRAPPYDKYVFTIRASYREETRALVDYLCDRGYRKIGFFGQADAYGKAGELGVIDALEAHGLKITAAASYRRDESFADDMSAQMNLLRSSGANAIIAVGVYGPSAAFIRAARLAGWRVPIANVSFVDAQALLDTLRSASAGSGRDFTSDLINSEVVPPPRSNCPLTRDYRAHIPAGSVNWTSLEGWLNAVVVTEALKRAGPSATAEQFVRAMESLNGWDPGIGTKLAFSRSSHVGLHKVWLTRSWRGQWAPLP